MIIKEIEINNFRIYKDKNSIHLGVSENRNIIIISGRNGFGKTTFLMSLVWCLYGRQMKDVDDLYKKEIEDQGGYGKYVANTLNRASSRENHTTFSVAVTFTNVDIPEVPCQELTVKRTYNPKSLNGEDIEILVDGELNELAKEAGPELFIREFIMPIEIAKFFFFDAEKIVNLAEVNSPEQKRKLSKAYSEVLGIKKYEDLKSEYESLQIKLRQESASASEKAEFRRLESDLKGFEDELAEIERDRNELQEKKAEKTKDSRDLQEKLIKAGNAISLDELEELRKKAEELESSQESLQARIKEYYDIIPFAIAGEKLLETYNQVENEFNYKAAKYKEENIIGVTEKILTDLFNMPKPADLVIEHKVHDYYARTFDALIRKYFFQDLPQLPKDFMVFHDFSETEKSEFQTLINNIKISFKDSFKRTYAEYTFTKNELASVRRKIREAESSEENPMIAEYRRQKDEVDVIIQKIESALNDLTSREGAIVFQRSQTTKQVNELAKKLDVSEKNKTKDEVLARNIGNLKKFISEFKARKKASLEDQMLESLKLLLHKKDFVKRVEVEILGEDIDILLIGQDNQEIKKETLSKGEQQMYATALLKSLVDESDFQFPIFIDSPMQKFDEKHAENIVRHFYPNVSDQVVIFPLINKELTAREFGILEKKLAKTYLINNVNKDKSEFVEVEPAKFLEHYNTLYGNVN